MKKIYLVWQREEGDTEDRIRGAALNWERAERMARTLQFHLGNVEVGVKTFLHGEMFLDSEGCDNRWSADKFEEEQDESFATND